MQLADVPTYYNRAARGYDLLTALIFERLLGYGRYRQRTVELLGELDGATVLDLGCGTGRNFPLLLPRIGTRGRLIGLDYASGMLARARRRIDRGGWTNVTLRQDDAATQATVDEPVDAVIATWSLGIVHDLDGALEQAAAHLRPGGRMAILDFHHSRPQRGLLRHLSPLYHRLLRWTGIDSPEDLDDARLHAKWTAGRRTFGRLFELTTETTYGNDAGLLLAGQRAG